MGKRQNDLNSVLLEGLVFAIEETQAGFVCVVETWRNGKGWCLPVIVPSKFAIDGFGKGAWVRVVGRLDIWRDGFAVICEHVEVRAQ